ncbi:MAG TPA: CapA family protein [Acidobacteriota bacterium]|nr:CapA family protein [Acidobacteriota bacterium]
MPPPVVSMPVDIWLGGDVHLGKGNTNVLAPLKSITHNATGIINLEGAVAETSSLREGIVLLNAPHRLAILKEAGVAVAGVANNHAQDAGDQSLVHTVEQIRMAGLLPVGEMAGTAVFERERMRLVVSAHDLTGGVPPRLAEELRRARAQGDILIATFHVTGPPSYLPSRELKQAVDIALSAGAQVIAAHGSHLPGPIERRGPAVILWGLGNLVFDCDCTAEKDALVARITFDQGQVIKAQVFPIEAGLNGAPARLSANPAGMFELLTAIGSSPFQSDTDQADF